MLFLQELLIQHHSIEARKHTCVAVYLVLLYLQCPGFSCAAVVPCVLQNMGTMSVLPVLGQHLNTYLPLLLVVHCLLIWLNMWEKLAGACVGSKYKFTK